MVRRPPFRRGATIAIHLLSGHLAGPGRRAHDSDRWGIFLLEPPMVDWDGRRAPRDRQVLGVLAVQRGQVVMPDQVADAVWGDHPPTSWPNQVQICVGRLCKALGATAIDMSSGGYRVTLGGDEVVLDRFEQLVAQGRASAAAGDPERAVTAFSRGWACGGGGPSTSSTAGSRRATRRRGWRNCTAASEEVLATRLATGEGAAAAEPLVAAGLTG